MRLGSLAPAPSWREPENPEALLACCRLGSSHGWNSSRKQSSRGESHRAAKAKCAHSLQAQLPKGRARNAGRARCVQSPGPNRTSPPSLGHLLHKLPVAPFHELSFLQVPLAPNLVDVDTVYTLEPSVLFHSFQINKRGN